MITDNQDGKENRSVLKLMTEKLAEQAARKISIDKEMLEAYLIKKGFSDMTALISIYRLIEEHNFDPMLDCLDYFEGDADETQAKKLYVTLNGCIKIMNNHPSFQGIEFMNSATLANGAPTWIECAIYRSDRIRPTIVREYLSEANLENEVWQKMPARMLRNRALTQCVKLAFGVNAIDTDSIKPRDAAKETTQKTHQASRPPKSGETPLGKKELKLKLGDKVQDADNAKN